ncbi:hypothetical protein DAERI_020418 [Deinococcus aerius]|uniref:Uncharacterized protein n=2 Tax=Deinococcus TaxID=1298 RepID=A0A2I9DJ68_9DEIO|nr:MULTISPECIES: hypothetical protein [Deinococcus]MBB5293732.1 hypothetical protein [Deinococcus metallilatus]QBY07304.1 hypothetical protein E5F05_04805 [Deinococcus metallilatus]RXJ14777.1 hypothetical protein ERJ73_03530 [Deinococcus metallilatus]TLK30897.1 hypothetical protein FCS05_03845 [Deinococcus metallilatus]GBF04821.1 hypothetical protein DAERI_020418 [Deinococcus aerius]
MKPIFVLLAVALLGLAGVGGWWLTQERRWQGDLFCIERPGTLWNGLAPLPSGLTPECPTYSRGYRAEVHRGEARVEMYRLPGWQPKVLLDPFKRAGYGQRTDDVLPGNYTAFLDRGGELLQYHAVQEGETKTTLITISGQP